jgi:5-methylthioribose kinase
MHLDKNQLPEIENWLRNHQIIASNEPVISAEKAGEGNMNYTLRVKTTERSLILKQARPYVEKYPTIPAPIERAEMEAAFFAATSSWDGVGEMLPKLLYFSPDDHLQVIEDLGEGTDFTSFYQRTEALPPSELAKLLTFLKTLHQQSQATPPSVNFQNRSMRELNHFHIFDFPFQQENGLNLDTIQPGLQSLAERTIFAHPTLRPKSLALGQIYLADGDTLLHGDFFPGSWLCTSRGVFVIDPEFCFRGTAAFDLGVCLAHLCFCDMTWGTALDCINTHYGEFDAAACQDFAAVEILRRFFGVAQLPLDMGIPEKEALTRLAIEQLGLELEL